MMRVIGALLLVGGWLHAQAITPMIGATVDVAPYGIEQVYASLALSASLGESPSIALWGVALAARDALYFRTPIIFSIRPDQLPPLSLLVGGGPGSWGYSGSVKIFAVLYGGVAWSTGGWIFTVVVSDVVGPQFSDLLLDLYVGRVFRP